MSQTSDFLSDDSLNKDSFGFSEHEEEEQELFSPIKEQAHKAPPPTPRPDEKKEGEQSFSSQEILDDKKSIVNERMQQKAKKDNVTSVSKKNKKREPNSSQQVKKKRAKMVCRNFMDTEALVDDSDDDDDEEDLYQNDSTFLNEEKEARNAAKNLGRPAQKKEDSTIPWRYQSHLETAIGSLESRYQNEAQEDEEEDLDNDLENDLEDDLEDDSEQEEEEEEEEEDDFMDDLDDDERLAQDAHDADPRDTNKASYSSQIRRSTVSHCLMNNKDVQLWKIRTAKGTSSQSVVISILNKFVTMKQREQPFQILSAFAPHGIRGHIYVEARNLPQIKEALSGLRSLILSSIRIVPTNEMNSVFGMGERGSKTIHRNELVRVRGGLYAGDLAQVTGVDELNGNVWIRVIPRLNHNDLFDAKSNHPTDKTRQVARLLTREEIEAKDAVVKPGPRWGTFRFAGRVFTDSGYVLKNVKRQMLITGPDVAATDEEVKEFGRGIVPGKDELGSQEELLAALNSARQVVFNTGDKIVIHSGDVAGVRGVVVSIEGRTVNVQLENKSLQDVISVEAHDIVKYFQVGDSVKVVSGENCGASGLITAVDLKERMATVFYPVLGKTFRSYLDDLQSYSDVGMAMTSTLGGYSVGDLVQLSERETGVIVRIDSGGAFLVLTPNNKVEAVPLSRVAGKRSNEFAVAVDHNNVKFGVKTVVTFMNNRKKITGRVCHIWKTHVFVKLRNKDEGHHGFMVCDSKDVSLRLSDGCTPADTSNWSNNRSSAMKHPPKYAPERQHRGPFRGQGGRGWIGCRVRVISGRNKGSFGIVLGLESGGRLRIRLSQNDLAACFHRNELIILDQPNHSRFSRRSFSDSRPEQKHTVSDKNNNWSDFFGKVRNSDISNNVSQSV